MTSEIETLTQKISSAKEVTSEVVDAMNNLAALQLESDVPVAIETSKRAIDEAREIQYAKGEALALMQAGMGAAKLRNFDDAYSFYGKALDLREKMNDQEGVAIAQAKLGNVKLHSGKYTEALEHYKHAIEIRTMLGDALGTADLQSNSGIIYGFTGNYPLALKSHLGALKTYEQMNEQLRVASTCSNIGIIYYEQHNFEEALQMYQRALKIYKEVKDAKNVSNLMNNIGLVYHDQKKYQEAKTMHERTLELRQQTGDKAKIATSLSNLGDVYKALGQHVFSLDYYTKALALFEELNEKRGLVPTNYNIGELYFIQKNYAEAEKYLNKAIEVAEETGLKDHLREAYEHMAKIYAEGKNFEEAFKYQLRYTDLDKEISNNETSRMIAQMTMRHEIEQKERDTELERVKNAELTKAYNSLDEEKKRSESLLLNILPEEVADELKQNGKATAKYFENVTVLFTDFKGFTTISEKLSPQDLVNELHECFKGFDEIIAKYNIEKIKTVGDAYLAASGLPTANANHAEDMVKAAIEIRGFMKKRKKENSTKETFEVRIGIHSGHVVAGIVGATKFAYDIWGDTVNTAARMEQNSEAGKINISQSTYELVQSKFDFEYRGEIDAKNKGKLKMYFVNG